LRESEKLQQKLRKNCSEREDRVREKDKERERAGSDQGSVIQLWRRPY
jgi:hypothetical protein